MGCREFTRREFLLTAAALAATASGTALFGCSAKSGGAQQQATQDQNAAPAEEAPTPEPGSSADCPIEVKMGDEIRTDDAILTVDSCDGFCEEFVGSDPTYSLRIDDGKLAFLVRCTLTYEGKSEMLPSNCIKAQVAFDGDYKFSANVEDTEKIVSSIAPLETRGETLCAQIAEGTAKQLTGPVLLLSVAKRFDPDDGSKETVHYRCPLS